MKRRTMLVIAVAMMVIAATSQAAYYEDFETTGDQYTLEPDAQVDGGYLHQPGWTGYAELDGTYSASAGAPSIKTVTFNMLGNTATWMALVYQLACDDGTAEGIAFGRNGIRVQYAANDNGYLSIYHTDDGWTPLAKEATNTAMSAGLNTDYDLVIEDYGTSVNCWVQEAANPANKTQTVTADLTGYTRHGNYDGLAYKNDTGTVALGTGGFDSVIISDALLEPVATTDDLGGVVVTEDQSNLPTDTYEVSMLSAPPIDKNSNGIEGVKLTMEFPSDQISIDPDTAFFDVIFTAGNWETPQTFTVTAIDDLDPQGDRTVDIIHSLTVLDPDDNVISLTDPTVADPRFINPIFEPGTQIVPVTILDDEQQYGVLIDPNSIAVSEQEPATATDTYTVVLQRSPTITVPVNISITDGQTTVDKPMLLFNSSNWDVPQVVTVTAVDDTVGEDDPHTGQILHSIPDLGTSPEELAWFNAPIEPGPLVEASISDNDCLEGREPLGDLDGDCDVDLVDFAAIVANWLKCTLPNVPGCE
jgi:hypothetical protein